MWDFLIQRVNNIDVDWDDKINKIRKVKKDMIRYWDCNYSVDLTYEKVIMFLINYLLN